MTRSEPNSMQTIAVQYAILGKLTAKPKIDWKRVKVRKKAHIIRAGRAICRAENAYKKLPRYTQVESPEPWEICRICLGMDGRARPRHPVRREAILPHAVIAADVPHEGQVMPQLALARADALEQLGEGEYAEPLLSVLMGERVDEGLPDGGDLVVVSGVNSLTDDMLVRDLGNN